MDGPLALHENRSSGLDLRAYVVTGRIHSDSKIKKLLKIIEASI